MKSLWSTTLGSSSTLVASVSSPWLLSAWLLPLGWGRKEQAPHRPRNPRLAGGQASPPPGLQQKVLG